MGTSKGITRRNYAKNKIIRFYYCEFHYDRILKTERYVSVQVVLLLTLTVPYQGFDLEVVLKYGNGLRFSIRRRYVPALLDLTKFPLTKPAAALAETASGLPEGILEITKNMRLKIRKTRRRDLK